MNKKYMFFTLMLLANLFFARPLGETMTKIDQQVNQMVPLVAIIFLITGIIISVITYFFSRNIKNKNSSNILVIIGFIIGGFFILLGIVGLIILLLNPTSVISFN